MIIKLLFAFLLLLMQCLPVLAQKVITEEDLRGETFTIDFGMNRKHYWHSYMGAHFPTSTAPDQAGAVAAGKSWTFEYGFRYKRRFNNTFSGGLETVLKRSSFHPEQFLPVEIPQDYTYDKEKFVFLSLGLASYQRINFWPRGNYIGRFLDLGAYGDLHYNVRHIMRLKGAEDKLRIRRSHMDLHELFAYGLLVRLGFNNFILKGSYRLSDTFKPETALPEFSRLSLGLELGLHPF